ncbi:DUF6134 family protein [Seonamhaeicola aphaedonensis]|uniref:Uncharacterized protein n=1 Tax=Seonamhaeicola aphaedonensis TaxID=1461338 RepID=A0A3D9HKX5_9FLAO|nr:DUF6134 family protein [Seonamhaeicola aphaedonensis]RED50157.1 hypothetical protein DFQ02_101180 [Seonamhaeicola aphaedonensis]
MIPMLIMYVLRRSKYGSIIVKKIESNKRVFLRFIMLLAILLVTKVQANTGGQSLRYSVVKNNKVIGSIAINKSEGNNTITYTLKSEINAKYIIRFNIEGSERSVYKNGKLIFSSVLRKVNNKVKSNHSISFHKGYYNLKTSESEERLNFRAIAQNLIILYFNEPLGVREVYCDNQRKMAKINRLSNGSYKVNISKDKYNIFHYERGRCVKVEAFSSIFKVILIPDNNA